MLEILSHPLSSVALGVLLSLGVIIFTTENPAKLPLHQIFFRALPGGLFFLSIFSALSYLVREFMLLPPPFSRLQGLGLWCFGVIVGFGVPLLVRATKNKFINIHVAQGFHHITVLLQFLDEITARYYGRIIEREERKLSYAFKADTSHKAQCAVHRLFEHHLEDIARHRAATSEYADEERIRGFTKSRHPGVKFKALLRCLGYKEFIVAYEEAKKAPESVIPSWPYTDDPKKRFERRIQHNDRRSQDRGHQRERRLLRYGRRKLDRPEVLDYILAPIIEKNNLVEETVRQQQFHQAKASEALDKQTPDA